MLAKLSEEISITNSKTSSNPELSDFESLSYGYDLKLERETADAWYITCKKSRDNKKKDDPKKIDLAVSKATWLPIYIRVKQLGVSVSFDNVTLGVSEESVTFRESDYPGVPIIDKR